MRDGGCGEEGRDAGWRRPEEEEARRQREGEFFGLVRGRRAAAAAGAPLLRTRLLWLSPGPSPGFCFIRSVKMFRAVFFLVFVWRAKRRAAAAARELSFR